MATTDELAHEFEQRRPWLRTVAVHVLGSHADAEDAVQETWLRLARTDAGQIDNLDGWLRTTLVRIAIDLLRTPRRRREAPAGETLVERLDRARAEEGADEAVARADAVSRALLVVLDALAPDERVAFVLHDVFDVPFAQIAPLVERSPDAAKQLASRARRRVRGRPDLPAAQLAAERRTVEAFLAATRAGDLDAVVRLLAPDVERHADAAVLPAGAPGVVRGRDAVARSTALLGARARWAEPALLDGRPGAVVVLDGELVLALRFVIHGGLVLHYEVLGERAALDALTIGVLEA